jgi:hypothetical protein
MLVDNIMSLIPYLSFPDVLIACICSWQGDNAFLFNKPAQFSFHAINYLTSK